jgi:hypothetical protein
MELRPGEVPADLLVRIAPTCDSSHRLSYPPRQRLKSEAPGTSMIPGAFQVAGEGFATLETATLYYAA